MKKPTTIPLELEESLEEESGEDGEEEEVQEHEEEEEEEEEEEAQEESEVEELFAMPIIPQKRDRGQLKVSRRGSEDFVRVSNAQVDQISDQVAQRLKSSLRPEPETTKKKKK